MYKLSTEFIEALQNGTHRTLNILWEDGTEVENENIWSESLEISNTLTDSEQIGFGKCNASTMNITIAGVDKTCIGKKVYLRLFLDGFAEFLPLGIYTIESAEKQDNKSFRKITAYDDMRLLQQDVSEWYNSLNLAENPISQGDMLKSLLEHCGMNYIPREIEEMVNSNVIVEETIKPSKLQGLQVAEAILELSGCFGTIDRTGFFRVVSLKHEKGLYPAYNLIPSMILYPKTVVGGKFVAKSLDKSFYEKCTYEEFDTKPINCLQLRTEEGDIGYIINAESDDVNAYIVTNNFLIYGKKHEELGGIASNMISIIKNFYYTPMEIDLHNIPYLELGDVVGVYTDSGMIATPILIHSVSGIQSFRQSISSKGTEYLDFSVTEANEEIEQLRGWTNSLIRTVTETVSKLADREAQTESTVTQLAGQIVTEITVEGETVSRFSQELGRFMFEGDTFEIQTNNITIKGSVLKIDNGEIGGLKIGAEGLADEEYGQRGLSIKKNGDGSFRSILVTVPNSGKAVKINLDGNGSLTVDGATILNGNTLTNSLKSTDIECTNLAVTGSKNKLVHTKSFGDRLMYSFETPEPLFADRGRGQIENGECKIKLNEMYLECVSHNVDYDVMLTKYGQGDCWVEEITDTYFVVKGTEGLRFSWMLMSVQIDCEDVYLDEYKPYIPEPVRIDEDNKEDNENE